MQKFNLKSVFLFLGLFLLALTVACSSPSGSSDVDASDNKQETATGDENALQLLIPNYYNDVEKEQWSQVVEKFKELNPGIEVILETGDVRVESGGLTTLLQSGANTPDAILMNAGPARISVLSEGELIKPLNDLYEKNSWDQALRPFAYNLVSSEEHIYEVPHMIDAIAHFYNKDIFEELGIKEPETSDEYIQMLDTLVAEADVDPIAVGARNGYAIGWLFGVMLESMAGTDKLEEVFFGDGKWSDPEIVAVAETMKEWLDKGYISEDAVTLQEEDAKFKFLNKQAAVYSAGTYLITELAAGDLQEEVGFFMAPSFVSGEISKPTGGVGQSWVIPQDAKNAEAAEMWLEFILSKDYAEIVYGFEDYNFILASLSSTEVEPAGETLRNAVATVEDGSGYNPSVFIGVETGEAYTQNLQGLVGGLVSPQEAMEAIEEAAQVDKANGFQLKN